MGDVAYIPRGCVHEARSTDTVSLHITVGILAYTWTDFLIECVADACLRDAAYRRSLPPGFANKEFPAEQAHAMFYSLMQGICRNVRLLAKSWILYRRIPFLISAPASGANGATGCLGQIGS